MENDKTTAVALTTDMAVPDLMKGIQAELDSLKAVTDRPYKTSGALPGFSNIKDETKVENLIRAWSMINGKQEAYEKAAQEMGLQNYPAFTIEGALPSDVKEDITTRLNVIQYEDRKKKLEDYHSRMSKFLSADDQKAILLKEMSDFIKGGK